MHNFHFISLINHIGIKLRKKEKWNLLNPLHNEASQNRNTVKPTHHYIIWHLILQESLYLKQVDPSFS